jgi:hypothetical protein
VGGILGALGEQVGEGDLAHLRVAVAQEGEELADEVGAGRGERARVVPLAAGPPSEVREARVEDERVGDLHG